MLQTMLDYRRTGDRRESKARQQGGCRLDQHVRSEFHSFQLCSHSDRGSDNTQVSSLMKYVSE